MTTQELTSYVRAIVDHKRIYDYVDPAKDIHLMLPVNDCRKGWKIRAEYISEIKLLAIHDPDGRGITTYEPQPVRDDDWFYWFEKEGVSKLHKEVEQMIDRINKIEL